MQFSLVRNEEGDSFITVFVKGQKPLVADSTHPNFDRIVAGVFNNDESIAELFNIAEAAATRFDRLTERVTTANGRLYFDGVEVDNALSRQVVRFLSEGVEDWRPLVNFFENVEQNPNEHSREQLFNWLNERDFTITEDGLIVGYKGVQLGNDEFTSIFTGKAIVDGEVFEGHIPNRRGSVVEMPRDEVLWDPAIGCHQGLHVGTYEYADNFAKGALLEVHVNPRDVVSVPTENDWAKMRVCRYTVIDTIDAPHTVPVIYEYDTEDDTGIDFCYECGDDITFQDIYDDGVCENCYHHQEDFQDTLWGDDDYNWS